MLRQFDASPGEWGAVLAGHLQQWAECHQRWLAEHPEGTAAMVYAPEEPAAPYEHVPVEAWHELVPEAERERWARTVRVDESEQPRHVLSAGYLAGGNLGQRAAASSTIRTLRELDLTGSLANAVSRLGVSAPSNLAGERPALHRTTSREDMLVFHSVADC